MVWCYLTMLWITLPILMVWLTTSRLHIPKLIRLPSDCILVTGIDLKRPNCTMLGVGVRRRLVPLTLMLMLVMMMSFQDFSCVVPLPI
jgi:hypothetical protein